MTGQSGMAHAFFRATAASSEPNDLKAYLKPVVRGPIAADPNSQFDEKTLVAWNSQGHRLAVGHRKRA